ncbi:MAG: MerR family transcriptional regulator [Acidimicrobiia bacterium]|nr:MerR family transcriptional regulator [bacterium]MYB25262.1 MerR family transcriptional regulator [Acidimicrobiia bacterium]
MAEEPLAAISEVVTGLRADYPDVSVSKLRFLESQGLITPQRTSKGYRKYSRTDVAKLRWILSQQRENFLPLRVIRERMADVEWSTQAEQEDQRLPDVDVSDRVRRLTPRNAGPDAAGAAMTLPQLANASGLSLAAARELTRYGLLVPRPTAEIDFYDAQALEVARIARQMLDHGLEPRHLRLFKASVDRELDLATPEVQRLLQGGGADAQLRARQLLATLAALAASLREALVARTLQNFS